jgi:hypothetical protein
MFKVQTKGMADGVRELTDIERNQIPYATKEALNETCALIEEAIETEMKSVFDRPTPYTLDSLRTIHATKDKLEARVWIKNEADGAAPATRWLTPEVYGGDREDKRTETLLKARGILGEGQYVVPGQGAKLDRFGNMTRGTLQRIYSGLGAQFEKSSNSSESRRSLAKGNRKSFFVMRRGRKAIGIGQRTGRPRAQVQIALAFVSRPGYSKILDFDGIAQRVADDQLPIKFAQALARAILSPKRAK